MPEGLAMHVAFSFQGEPAKGADELIHTLNGQWAAANRAGRPMAPVRAEAAEDAGGATVFVSSELFDVTVEVKVHLNKPAGSYLDRFVDEHKLPRTCDYKDRGAILRFEYTFIHADDILERSRSLAEQGVANGSVLILGCLPKIVRTVRRPPIGGYLRGGDDGDEREEERALERRAKADLRDVLVRSGLRRNR
jgi:hypothetical protein